MPALKNAKHERFAQEIVKGTKMVKAYRLAGFNVKNEASAAAAASRLLKSDNVLARIDELNKRAANKAVLTKQWVIERLMKNAQIALGEIEIEQKVRDKKTGEVKTVTITERDAPSANRALELLGKTVEVRAFVDQVEHGQAGEFDAMSEDELIRYIREQEEAIGLYDAEPGSDAVN